MREYARDRATGREASEESLVNTDLKDHAAVSAFRQAAERVCLGLESPPGDAQLWVETLLVSLASLYAAGHLLPGVVYYDDRAEVPEAFDVSNDEWREVYGRVQGILGVQTLYRSYFDPTELSKPVEEEFGDLADDLADIYRDVKPGLRAWESGDDRLIPGIIFNWTEPRFSSHWGVHAVSAMTALHPLAYLRGVQGACSRDEEPGA